MHVSLQNQSLNGYHGTERKDDSLREFYQKLSYFLMSGEHSNKEIMEEIERQISNLQQKVNVIYFCHNHRFWHTVATCQSINIILPAQLNKLTCFNLSCPLVDYLFVNQSCSRTCIRILHQILCYIEISISLPDYCATSWWFLILL